MSIADREAYLKQQIRKRKRYREFHRKRKEGRKARREASAIRRLRRELDALRAPKTQYDSVSVQYIPPDAGAVAFYINGLYANGTACKKQAPNARFTGISVTSRQLGQCLDIEPGDATISDVPDYHRRFRKAHPHVKPIYYTSASNVDALVNTLASIGVKRSEYIIWSAHYTGRHICGRDCSYAKAAGRVDATQYTTSGGKCDVSVCLPSYWRRHR